MKVAGAAITAGAIETETERRAAATLSVGMAVALGALAMTFGAVLLAYAVVRVQASSWPPPGEEPPAGLWPWPLAATVAALAGSGALLLARRRGGDETAGQTRRFERWLLVAAAAGAAFLGIQLAAWVSLLSTGVRPGSGLVASVVYALTLFHAVHALAALMALMPLLWRARRRRPVRAASFRAVSSLWHLVTAVWLVVFVAVFIA